MFKTYHYLIDYIKIKQKNYPDFIYKQSLIFFSLLYVYRRQSRPPLTVTKDGQLAIKVKTVITYPIPTGG